jgi:hypothetical protein
VGLSLSLRIQPRIEQALTHEQRHFVRQEVFARRTNLLGDVRGGEYKPKATCPGCSYHLEPLEIVDGFLPDPANYTTKCPKCRTRFAPQIVWRFSDLGQSELPFYCAVQVLPKLHGLEVLSPADIEKECPAVYHSALVHYGTLCNAFKKAGIQYGFQNVLDWKEKVRGYLGKLPDTVIAEIVDVSVRAVLIFRNSLGIDPFSRRELAEES